METAAAVLNRLVYQARVQSYAYELAAARCKRLYHVMITLKRVLLGILLALCGSAVFRAWPYVEAVMMVFAIALAIVEVVNPMELVVRDTQFTTAAQFYDERVTRLTKYKTLGLQGDTLQRKLDRILDATSYKPPYIPVQYYTEARAFVEPPSIREPLPQAAVAVTV
jgi:hypothetical protein